MTEYRSTNLFRLSGRTYSASSCAHASLQHTSVRASIGQHQGLVAGGSRVPLHSRNELALDAPVGGPDHWASGASMPAPLKDFARADTVLRRPLSSETALRQQGQAVEKVEQPVRIRVKAGGTEGYSPPLLPWGSMRF